MPFPTTQYIRSQIEMESFKVASFTSYRGKNYTFTNYELSLIIYANEKILTNKINHVFPLKQPVMKGSFQKCKDSDILLITMNLHTLT